MIAGESEEREEDEHREVFPRRRMAHLTGGHEIRACLIATNASPQKRMRRINEACRVHPRSGRPRSAISAEVAVAIKRYVRQARPSADSQEVHVREVGYFGLEEVRGVGRPGRETPAQFRLPALQHLRVV